MKRIGNLYDAISSPDNIRAAILNASRGKRNHAGVQAILDDLDNKTVELSTAFKTDTLVLHSYTPCTRKEGSNNKTRLIHKPQFWPDQCIHWAIYNVIGPIIYKSFYPLTCGSIPGRGVHYGKRFIERWVQRDWKNTRYYLKMDVHHFYPSIPNEKIKAAIRHKFKDKRLLALIDRIIDMDDGLPIGMLLSQCFANFYLAPLDFYIKQQLGAVYYMRYMDDMVVFGPNKKKLHRMRVQIQEWLREAGLELKSNWQVRKTKNEPLDFMGFRFFRDRTILRRAIMFRITRRVNRVGRKGARASARDAAAVVSYMGWIRATNTYGMYEKWIKPKVSIKRMKSIIRRESHVHCAIAKHRAPAGMGYAEQSGDRIPQH